MVTIRDSYPGKEGKGTKHPQKLVTFGDESLYVDSTMADLLLELWNRDISTTFSCQGGDGLHGYIAFSSSYHGMKFVQELREDSLLRQLLAEKQDFSEVVSRQFMPTAFRSCENAIYFDAEWAPRILGELKARTFKVAA